MIFIFSLIFLFDLNNTKIPIPEPTNKPAIIEPKVIKLFKYNSVIITEPAQFGINPTNAETNIPTKGTLAITFAILSFPIKYIAVFITNVITTINTNILTVCFIAGFKIPYSQPQDRKSVV